MVSTKPLGVHSVVRTLGGQWHERQRLAAELPQTRLSPSPGGEGEPDLSDPRRRRHHEHDAPKLGAAHGYALGADERPAPGDVIPRRIVGTDGRVEYGTVWRVVRVRDPAGVIEAELHRVEPVTLPRDVDLAGRPRVAEHLYEGDGHLLACAVPGQDEDRPGFREVGRAGRDRCRRRRGSSGLPSRHCVAAVPGQRDHNSDRNPDDGDRRAKDGARDPVPFRVRQLRVLLAIRIPSRRLTHDALPTAARTATLRFRRRAWGMCGAQ